MAPKTDLAIPYPEVMAAVGRLIAKRGLRRVCVMEFEEGVIVTGSTLFETQESYNERTETHVLSTGDLERLTKEH
ncbi:MAG: hypothetical protein M1132_01965 [Chloroflexi bacterium]|nr:hypothetical protein [Chloroflexota bacterium]MCL5950478.1 hypothetical protein [Chloroflexota bacterium]